VIFEISRDVCYEKGSWVCKLDLLPALEAEELLPLLKQKTTTALTAEDLLTGILHNRLGRVLTKMVGITGSCRISELNDEQLKNVCRACKTLEIAVDEPMGMDHAQVTAGGVLTGEFNPNTMESRLVPGLYACGEVLDIDGDCGGYNLQWAWSSGRLAGESAGGK
jgi:predicted Rossmann fold flavoprotein